MQSSSKQARKKRTRTDKRMLAVYRMCDGSDNSTNNKITHPMWAHTGNTWTMLKMVFETNPTRALCKHPYYFGINENVQNVCMFFFLVLCSCVARPLRFSKFLSPFFSWLEFFCIAFDSDVFTHIKYIIDAENAIHMGYSRIVIGISACKGAFCQTMAWNWFDCGFVHIFTHPSRYLLPSSCFYIVRSLHPAFSSPMAYFLAIIAKTAAVFSHLMIDRARAC